MSRSRSSDFHPNPSVYSGHTGTVYSVAISPDGNSVVSGSTDNTVRIWDANSPFLIGQPLQGHASLVWSVACSPDGNIIASGSGDHTIRLWDMNTHQLGGDPLRGHENDVLSVAFSPSGNHLASGSKDKTIKLWSTQNGSRALSTFSGHTNWVDSVRFSPDGTRLVSCDDDASIHLWDAERATTILGPIRGHKRSVYSVVFSHDGSQIISGSVDRTIRLWDTRTGSPIGKPYEGHSDEILSVSLSPNGIYIASGSTDMTVRVWDIRTGRQVDEPLRHHTGGVTSVVFLPCGRRIVSGARDNTVMVYELDYYLINEDKRYAAEGDGLEDHEVEGNIDQIDQSMSVQDMLQLLSLHGCVSLDSRMDSSQQSAILLSGGGFGDIWRGELLDQTKVAIKAWRASVIEQCDYKMLKRATREIHYWSKMKHPNVHELLGVIAFKGQSLGMVSEWMENGNLHEYLRRSPEADRLKLSSQVASGLAYVHDCGVVHGDIKALNVLVSSSGVAKLTDFGLSTMSESSIVFSSTTTTLAGSVRWMAPELLLEESPKSKASDIYALGMTILEIFTGKLPYSEYRRDAAITMMVMQSTLPIRPWAKFPENEHGSRIWNLLMSCWKKDPNGRLSAKRVVESLESTAREETWTG